METVFLYPSEILYSQESISCYFDANRGSLCRKKIGETLDDICEGRCCIYDIPQIKVCRNGTKWVAADNRRLWVFKQLERLGKCRRIEVDVVKSIGSWKQNSTTGGETVKVRGGDPGGNWYLKEPENSTLLERGSIRASRTEEGEGGASLFTTGLLLGGVALACNYLFNNK